MRVLLFPSRGGDFVGRGIWTLEPKRGADDPDGPLTLVRYDWRIAAEKFVLRRLSFIAKPVFSANHHWAMARGHVSVTPLRLDRTDEAFSEELTTTLK